MNDETAESLLQAVTALKVERGWPLTKEETFAAFALMGLASRLQPVQVESTEHQSRVTDLAHKLGKMLGKKYEP